MKGFVESGKKLGAREIFKGIDILLNKLEDFSFRRIGNVNDMVKFDPKFHQSMGGSSLEQGREVKIKIIGFTFKEKVIKKSMVTGKEVSS